MPQVGGMQIMFQMHIVDRNNLYYSSNGQDYIKVNVERYGSRLNRRYTISAEGLPTVDNLTGNEDIPEPYAGHLYRRNVEEVGTGEKDHSS